MAYTRKHPKIRSISSGEGKIKPPKKVKVKLCKQCGKELTNIDNAFYRVNKTCSKECCNKLIELKKKEKRKKEREKIGTNASIKTLKAQADAAMSNYIRERDNYTCCITGIKGDRSSIDNGHYIPRHILSLRYDETNCHAQSKEANSLHNIDREPYRQFILRKYGQEKIDEFSEKAKILTKGTKLFYLEWKKYYEEKLLSLSK